MKTVDCPDCGEVLDASRPWPPGFACPRCGHQLTVSRPAPAPRKSSAGLIVGITLAVILVLGAVMVVPVVGILAAIAIPNFLAMQLRAKRSEAPMNLDAIRTAEKAYHAEWDVYLPVAPTPAEVPGRDAVAFEGGGEADFWTLGWSPGVPVRCRYSVVDVFNGEGYGGDSFTAVAECDLDGDGVYCVYEATQDNRSTMITWNNVY
jgi:type II secretory pathway pseudopilin PulG